MKALTFPTCVFGDKNGCGGNIVLTMKSRVCFSRRSEISLKPIMSLFTSPVASSTANAARFPPVRSKISRNQALIRNGSHREMQHDMHVANLLSLTPGDAAAT